MVFPPLYASLTVIIIFNSSFRIAALNLWKNRVGPLGTYKNLLRILALGEWHDSANKIITFINSELNNVFDILIS